MLLVMLKLCRGTQEIKADSLKAFYNPQTDARTITRIIANGDVSFSDDAHNGPRSDAGL